VRKSRAWPLSCPFPCQRGYRAPDPQRHLETISRAAQTRLPHAVPLHPAPRPARPRRRRQGPGDPGPAPAAHRPPTPAPTTQAGTRRPRPARRHQPPPATRPLVVLLRHPGHPAALASPPGRRRVDLSAPRPRTATAGRRRTAADHPPRYREPALGLPAPQGRTPAAWRARLGHRDPVHTAPSRAWPGTATHDHHLAEVPAPAGRRDRRLRPASPSTPSGCAGCTCCSSSNWTPAGCTSAG